MNILSQQEDERLIKAVLDGNSEAFAHLVTKYKQRVFRLASRFAFGKNEVDDMCQEIFIKAYENIAKFRGEAPFEHWLSRVAVRTCYDCLRKNRKISGYTSVEELPLEIKDQNQESRDKAREAHNVLSWAFKKLRPDERLIITLLELEENSVREVADLTGWSESNVKVRAHRARNALKQILEEKWNPKTN